MSPTTCKTTPPCTSSPTQPDDRHQDLNRDENGATDRTAHTAGCSPGFAAERKESPEPRAAGTHHHRHPIPHPALPFRTCFHLWPGPVDSVQSHPEPPGFGPPNAPRITGPAASQETRLRSDHGSRLPKLLRSPPPIPRRDAGNGCCGTADRTKSPKPRSPEHPTPAVPAPAMRLDNLVQVQGGPNRGGPATGRDGREAPKPEFHLGQSHRTAKTDSATDEHE